MTDEFEELEFAISTARTLIRGGFETREEVIEYTNDLLEDEKIRNVNATEIVDREIEALCNEQEYWPVETDNDRLERVFERLEAVGIISRQNFTCCGTCGAAEIDYEVEDFEEQGLRARGYVFFHQQATESAVEGYGINFSYGSFKKNASDRDHEAIAQDLVRELKDKEFEVDWNGKLSMCVMVEIDWKRRWNSTDRFTQGTPRFERSASSARSTHGNLFLKIARFLSNITRRT